MRMQIGEIVHGHNHDKKCHNQTYGNDWHAVYCALNGFKRFRFALAPSAVVVDETLANGNIHHVEAFAVERAADTLANVHLHLTSVAVINTCIACAIERIGRVGHNHFGAVGAVLTWQVGAGSSVRLTRIACEELLAFANKFVGVIEPADAVVGTVGQAAG